MDKKANAEMLWSISTIAKGLRFFAPEMATLFFLKFTSDNAERLGIEIGKLNKFDALVDLYVNDTINQADFLQHCSEIVSKAGMHEYGIAEHFAQFISTTGDVQTTKRLLSKFRQFDFADDPSNCYVANLFNYYLTKDTGWDGLNKSAYAVADLMANIAVNPSTTAIYDGFCGYGISLAAASKKSPSARLFGQDLVINCVMVSAILQWLHFNKDFTLAVGNSVKNPLPGQKNCPKKFDAVIIDPPFGFRFEDDEISAFPEEYLAYKGLTQRRGDWFFIQHALAVLKAGGTAVVQVSMGTLFATGKALEIRKTVVDNCHLKAIIEFPGGVVPGTSIPVSLMVFGDSHTSDDVLMVNAASSAAEHLFNRLGKARNELSNTGVEELSNIVNNRIAVDGISRVVSLNEIKEKNYILTPSAYMARERNVYSYQSLSDICTELKQLEAELAAVNDKLVAAISEVI